MEQLRLTNKYALKLAPGTFDFTLNSDNSSNTKQHVA